MSKTTCWLPSTNHGGGAENVELTKNKQLDLGLEPNMVLPDIVPPTSQGPAVLVTPYPDIGHLASWSVSSHKLGFDVNCLYDDDPDTFWQCVASPSAVGQMD